MQQQTHICTVISVVHWTVISIVHWPRMNIGSCVLFNKHLCPFFNSHALFVRFVVTDLRFRVLTLPNPNHALRNIKVRTLRVRATSYSNPQAARAGGSWFCIKCHLINTLIWTLEKTGWFQRKQCRETFTRCVAWQEEEQEGGGGIARIRFSISDSPALYPAMHPARARRSTNGNNN